MLPNFIKKFLEYTNLESDRTDYDEIHQSIEKDIVFRGTNLWILFFAILVASVGLNMNSTAVIIGAMLISPLMGPINGMGYSLATYNFHLFRRAVKNFTFAVIAGLIASTLYFSVTPISTAYSELLARTSPTIYDVLIALFGGMAGIIAISAKNKGNVIPGVAIATALMPPLCTAGYGIATLQGNFFFGAIYLFTINTVFIALSSVIMSKVLKFPIRTIIEPIHKKKVNRWILITIVLIILPSLFFGYNLALREKFKHNASKFVNSISYYDGSFLLKENIDVSNRTINLLFGGRELNQNEINNIKKIAYSNNLDTSKIIIQQGFDFEIVKKEMSESDNLKKEINRLQFLNNEKERIIDSLNNIHKKGENILNELSILYPQIIALSISNSLIYNNQNNEPEKIYLIYIKYQGKLSNLDREKIQNWLSTRIKNNNIKLIFENF